MERFQMLLAAHNELVRAAGLLEGSRPYSVQSRLDEIEKLIMEEIKKEPKLPSPTPPNDDNIPF